MKKIKLIYDYEHKNISFHYESSKDISLTTDKEFLYISVGAHSYKVYVYKRFISIRSDNSRLNSLCRVLRIVWWHEKNKIRILRKRN